MSNKFFQQSHVISAAVSKAEHAGNEKAGLYDLDLSKLPEASVEYLLIYGLKQSLNDKVADKKYSGKSAHEAVLERINDLMEGTMGAQGKPRKRRTVESIVADFARKYVIGLYAKKGYSEKEINTETLKANVATVIQTGGERVQKWTEAAMIMLAQDVTEDEADETAEFLDIKAKA